jgi:serine protease
MFGAPHIAAQTARVADKVPPPSRELILLHKFEATSDVKKPEDIVDAVKNPGRSQQNQMLKDRLGSPADARFLISDRHNFSPDILKRSDTYPKDDPPEVMLQRYVVLTYADNAKMKSALTKTKADKEIRRAGSSGVMVPSASVSDPLAQIPATYNSLSEFQWGLYAIYAFQAWDVVRGHAYVGHLDTGIEIDHPDFLSKYRPQFSFNPYSSNSVDEAADGTAGPDDVSLARIGHGTHTAGIISAAATNTSPQYGHPNPTSQGIAGVCWNCTLMISKTQGPRMLEDGFVYHRIHLSDFLNSFTRTVHSGAQILNVSLGDNNNQENLYYPFPDYCSANPYDAYCVALDFAASRSVITVAAAGNGGISHFQLQFPARDSRTLPVGAIQYGGDIWQENPAQTDFYGSNTGPGMAARGVMAPGRDIVSTFYRNQPWNALGRCWDNPVAGVGYDGCTGTSMAAPHVTGVVALMRSVDPLLTGPQISAKLRQTSLRGGAPNNEYGSGTINAAAAVVSVANDTNRLTPLFSFYSYGAQNYFYTTVPQMGTAAVAMTLRPNAANWYSPLGEYVYYGSSYYFYFPGTYSKAKAQAWIFTTHVNPKNPNVELRPLYRMSYSCPQPYRPICATNPNHVDHAYTTDINDVGIFMTWGFDYDGIEGYVYPYGISPQPPNTEALIRAYNPVRDDHAVFPQSEWGNMALEGYTVNGTYLGYVYRNTNGTRPTY